jgi:hypothetical protein
MNIEYEKRLNLSKSRKVLCTCSFQFFYTHARYQSYIKKFRLYRVQEDPLDHQLKYLITSLAQTEPKNIHSPSNTDILHVWLDSKTFHKHFINLKT